MGSLCNSNNQTTSTYAPSPQAAQLYGQVINSAESAASAPYQAYGGELVAPLSGTQNAGIANINAASGIASPYINTAANYATQGAAPISAAAISNYENPYQSDVINSTIANINATNAQQRQALKGNAIASGAYGGDRAGIAQAELARQQGLASNQTLAGLNAQNYNQALGAAQADRNAAAQGAYTFGNLGSLAQNTALTGAGAQLQAGGLQQGTQQALDTANYQQYLQKLAFPYQQAQFLAGVGIPAASGFGGTQTTTPPSPSPFSQILGTAMTVAPFLLKRGGRVGGTIDLARGHDGVYRYAKGGTTPYSLPDTDNLGWIPSVQIQAPQMPKFGGAEKPQDSTAPLAAGLKTFGNAGGFTKMAGLFGGAGAPIDLGSGYLPSAMGDLNLGNAGGTGLAGLGGLFARGGLVETVHHLRGALKARRYADGGDVFADRFAGAPDTPYPERELPFDSRWVDVAPSYPPSLVSGLRDMANAAAPPAIEAPASAPSPLAAGPALAGADLPPEITAGQSAPLAAAPQGDALAYDQVSPLAGPAAAQGAPVAAPSGGGGLLARLGLGNGLGLSDDARTSLLAAGLGIMSGTSPYGLANIGQGGLKGLAQAQELRKEKMTRDELAQRARLEGQKLAQQLLLHREMTPYQSADLDIKREAAKRAEAQAQFARDKYDVPQGYRRTDAGDLEPIPGGPAAELRRQHDMAARAPVKIGEDRMGTPIMALPRPNPNGGVDYYRINRDGTIESAPMGAPQSGPALSPGGPGPSSALPSSPANAAQPTRTALATPGDIVTDAPPIQVRAAMPVASPQARDEQYIQQLAKDDPRYAADIKAIANYQMSPAQFSLRNNRRERAMGDVMMYDPTYDQRRYNQTNRAIAGWAQSPEGRATRSLSVTIEHLGTAEELGHALQNGDVRALNTLKNWAKTQFGYEGPVNFEFAKQIVADEIAKAVIGGQNGEADRRNLQEQISRSSSPEQLAGVVRTAKQLMAGQVLGLQHTYETATGLHNFDQWLTPRARTEIDRAAATHAAPAGGGAASPTATPPRVKQNGHTYERQPDGSYKAID